MRGEDMPTRTFYNLPDEKRKKLLDAIRKEFSRVPFDEVSVNQIIRMAGIPRGSFYQYFADREDMLQYLLTDYLEMLRRHALDSVRKNNGDLFQVFLDIFDFTYAFVAGAEHNAFFQNVFSDIRLNTELLHQQAGMLTFGGFAGELFSSINMDALDIRGDEDFGNMLGILLPLTGAAFTKVFLDITSYEHRRAQYAAQLELLKRGFLRVKGMDA